MTEVWATCLVAVAIAVIGYMFKNSRDAAIDRQKAFQAGIKNSLDIISTAITGLQSSINGLTGALGGYVQKTDCSADMGNHCQQLSNLQEDIKDNTQRIATLEAAVNIYHKNKLGD